MKILIVGEDVSYLRRLGMTTISILKSLIRFWMYLLVLLKLRGILPLVANNIHHVKRRLSLQVNFEYGNGTILQCPQWKSFTDATCSRIVNCTCNRPCYFLYKLRLVRGEYHYTISEMNDAVESTICMIVMQVFEALFEADVMVRHKVVNYYCKALHLRCFCESNVKITKAHVHWTLTFVVFFLFVFSLSIAKFDKSGCF